ncbi:tail completion protein gp17 [Marininema halotolerans]|uniref:DUF3168 domain-containing protein n=1 Tax=Marininema halotolerans TaxID=1155944 RepID=A0A1I6URM3_9BACL|nr:hypothetical protein [Marininema halotolerans]SFT04091.1 hypothetical protein SAMN05444972_11937 [Marininema halotolerans]
MIDIQKSIYQALSSSALLSTYVQSNAITYMVRTANTFPAITFYILDQTDMNYCDDSATDENASVQVSAWFKSSFIARQAIAYEVNRIMEGLGYVRTYFTDQIEDDTLIHQRIMRFRAILPK